MARETPSHERLITRMPSYHSNIASGDVRGRKRSRLKACIALVLVCLATAHTATLAQVEAEKPETEQESVDHGLTRRSLNFKGLERIYRVYVPGSYTGKKRVPLVFLLHGGGSDGRRMDRFTGFNRIAEDEGLILVAPDGVGRHWNDGRVATGYKAHETDVDDVGFVSHLIDLLSVEFQIDTNRIYAAGISNGGMMSNRLGLELPDKLAAIASVVASLPEPLAQKSFKSQPMPVIIVNGTDDPLVPWNGGDVRVFRKSAGRVLSTPDTVQFWLKHNKCSPEPSTGQLPDNDPGDGIRVIKSEYHGGADGAGDVTLYALEGGGHTWHGPRPLVQYLPPALIGRASKDFDATDVIWDFFQKHPRSDGRSLTSTSNAGMKQE